MLLFTVISAISISLLIYKCLFKNRKSSSVSSEVNDEESFDYDVAIVGSGITGSTLATVLARDGRKVVVIERNMKMPEKFNGEILQPRAFEALEELNLQECCKNIDAQVVKGFYLYEELGAAVKVEMKFEKNGFSLRNGQLVMNLRKAAMSEKNITYIEGKVVDLVESNDVITGIIYNSKDDHDEKVIKTKLTVVADGCLSRLRKKIVNKKPKQLSLCVGGIIKYHDDVPVGEVIFCLGSQSTVLIYRNETNSVRVLTELKEKVSMKDFKNYFLDSVYPKLPERFKAVALEGMTVSPITMMSTQAMTANPKQKFGALILGDAFNIRHPNTANGMTAIFCDVVLLRDLLSKIKNFSDYNAVSDVWKKFLKMRKNHSSVINSYSLFLHELFYPRNEGLAFLKKAYVTCLKHNDRFNRESVSILTSLDTSIYLLLSHITSISIFAVCMPFKENSCKAFFKSISQSISIIITIVKVLVPLIWSEI